MNHALSQLTYKYGLTSSRGIKILNIIHLNLTLIYSKRVLQEQSGFNQGFFLVKLLLLLNLSQSVLKTTINVHLAYVDVNLGRSGVLRVTVTRTSFSDLFFDHRIIGLAGVRGKKIRILINGRGPILIRYIQHPLGG